MRDDRQSAVDQILKAIEYGLLPVDEIERRLQKIISEELSCPIDAEYDEEKVEFCYSLLQQIHLEKRIDIGEHAEKIKAQITKQHNAYKRRKKALTRGLCAAAAVIVIFAGLTALNVIPSIQWFTGKPSDDNEHYIVTGHEINSQAAIAAITLHEDIAYFDSTQLQEVDSFLGFETGFPEKISEDFEAKIFHLVVSPTFLDIECKYSNKEGQTITLNAAVYENMDEAYIPFEQEEGSGKYIVFGGKAAYTFTNINVISYVWYSENVVYSLEYDMTISNSQEITAQLLEKWY